MKRSIIRGPRGELNVERCLDDLQDYVRDLRERFTARYAASSEVATVLKQASDIHACIKSQPGELKGGSEWDRLVVDLTRLAEAYGHVVSAQVRRSRSTHQRRETSEAADTLAKQADRLKSETGQECRRRSRT